MKSDSVVFVLSETYEVWTEDGIEAGEPDETGFSFQDETYSVEELERYLSTNGFVHLSSSQIQGKKTYISTDSDVDLNSGDSTVKSLHLKAIKDVDGNDLSDEKQNNVWEYMLKKQIDFNKKMVNPSPFDPADMEP